MKRVKDQVCSRVPEMMRKKRCSSKKQNAWYLLFCLVLFFLHS